MKTLKFRHHLVQEILDGRKTTTWRLFDDKNLTVEDKLEFLESGSNKKFAGAEIINIREKKLEDIKDADFVGHEQYQSTEEMLKHYKEYYGDKVSLETPIKIVSFKLI